jgi:hypothetical protein
MPKGGTRSRSGPPPDPNALRRDRDDAEWVTLPPAGREGEAPEWPLTAPTKRELAFWSRLWAKPQAVMWERLGQELEVALYVRRLVESERRGSAANLTTLVRQMADSLGLTTPGLRSNRWRIGKLAPDDAKARRAPVPSTRTRLRVVGDQVSDDAVPST